MRKVNSDVNPGSVDHVFGRLFGEQNIDVEAELVVDEIIVGPVKLNGFKASATISILAFVLGCATITLLVLAL